MCFHAGTPDIKSIMGHMQITRLSSVLGMDIRIVYIKIMHNLEYHAGVLCIHSAKFLRFPDMKTQNLTK